MKKLFQILQVNNNAEPARRHIYVPGRTPGGYDADRHFLNYDTQTFLEMFSPCAYGEITSEVTKLDDEIAQGAVAWMSRNARSTIQYPSLARGARPEEVKRWRWIYGQTKEGTHRAFFVDAASSIRRLEDLGITIHDAAKAGKRMRRILNYYPVAGRAKVISVERHADREYCVLQFSDGTTGVHLNYLIDQWDPALAALVDGKFYVNRQMAERLQMGKSWASYATVFNPLGVCKGVVRELPQIEDGIAIISYGAKPEVTFNQCFFGILNHLGHEDAMTDIQSFVNFDQWAWALPQVRELISDLLVAVHDEDKLRAELIRNLRQVTRPNEETWCLLLAVEKGYSIFVPGLFARVVNHLMSGIVDATRGRISMKGIAERTIVDTDVHMFDALGYPHPDRALIPAGHCVAMDLPEGPIASYRQPSGHKLEQSLVINIHLPAFERFRGRWHTIYGPDFPQFAIKKNGEDLDDKEVSNYRQDIVNLMRALKYPLTSKLSVAAAVKRVGRSGARLALKTGKIPVFDELLEVSLKGYTVQNFIDEMTLSLGYQIKLGQVVNLIILDTLLSGDHKRNMLKYLRAKTRAFEKAGDVENYVLYSDCSAWLKARKDYLAREAATNLEEIIDWTQQAKGDFDLLKPILDRLMEMVYTKDASGNVIVHTRVFPMMWAMSGSGFEGKGRISKKLVQDVDYVLAPSKACEVLAAIRALEQETMAAFRKYENKLVMPLPAALELRYPEDEGMRELAKDVRNWWNPLVISLVERFSGDDYMVEYKKLLGQLRTRWLGYSIECRRYLAVEMYRLTQKDKGKDQGVADSVFVNDVVWSSYIEACDQAGLTGHYATVTYDQSCRYLDGKTVKVTVAQGSVYEEGTRFWLGATTAPDGDWTVRPDGLIEVKAPHISITSKMRGLSTSDQDESLDVLAYSLELARVQDQLKAKDQGIALEPESPDMEFSGSTAGAGLETEAFEL